MYSDFIQKLILTYVKKEDYFWFRYMQKIYSKMQMLGHKGGICDMTFLNHFKKHKECNDKFTCGEMTDVITDTTFDDLLKNTTDYEADRRGIKNIIMKEFKPHCFNTKHNKLIRFNSLHFQGKHKDIMKDYITYNM